MLSQEGVNNQPCYTGEIKMKSLLRLTIIASFVVLLTFATTIPNRGVGSRAIVFNGSNQYARVTLPNSAPWTSLGSFKTVSYTHLRAHETPEHLVCRLL